MGGFVAGGVSARSYGVNKVLPVVVGFHPTVLLALFDRWHAFGNFGAMFITAGDIGMVMVNHHARSRAFMP